MDTITSLHSMTTLLTLLRVKPLTAGCSSSKVVMGQGQTFTCS